jgi:undecaprenyl-diphosphatase
MKSLTDWIQHLIQRVPGPAGLALIFALPALESSAFIGFIFPGETAAILGGVLAYEHRINLATAMIAVVAGAIIGDSVGYWVGHRWGNQLLEGPLSRWIKPSHVQRARDTISRRGGWAVVLGRFTAALRVLIPGIAGLARMPYRSFLFFNALGGTIWGVTFVSIGYAAGASWQHVASTASTVGLIVVGSLAVLVIAFIIVRRRRIRREEAVGGSGQPGGEPGAEPAGATADRADSAPTGPDRSGTP